MGTNQQDVIRRHLNEEERGDLKVFGKDIKMVRLHAFPDNSLREVAGYLGVNPGTLSMVETGQIFPTSELLDKMVDQYMTDCEDQPLKKAMLLRWLPKKRPPRGRASKVEEKGPGSGPKWIVGRKLFSMVIREWMEKEEIDRVGLASAAKMSLIYVKQLLSATHPVPPNDVCRRLAKALGKKPTKLLVLRMVACADHDLRLATMKKMWPWSVAIQMMESPGVDTRP